MMKSDVCIRRDGTPMSDEERRFKEAAFARIKQELREALRKKTLEDRANAMPPPKPKLEGKVLEFPPKLSEHELLRRQMVIDQAWERVLEERRELERMAERSCHRGPGDSDWNLR
jgi:hypothetical protein